jgi:hypothetical protein
MGLATLEPVTTVHVPCPQCGCSNQLCFEPDGTVRSVAPSYRGSYPVPPPSVN